MSNKVIQNRKAAREIMREGNFRQTKNSIRSNARKARRVREVESEAVTWDMSAWNVDTARKVSA